MARTFLLMAALSGFLAVAIGAFGAHILRGRLAPDLMAIYQTGVQYHFYHTFALLACGILIQNGFDDRVLSLGAFAFAIGIVIFSGSLYLLAITNIRWLGAFTPVGGLAFLVGWFAMATAVWRNVN